MSVFSTTCCCLVVFGPIELYERVNNPLKFAPELCSGARQALRHSYVHRRLCRTQARKSRLLQKKQGRKEKFERKEMKALSEGGRRLSSLRLASKRIHRVLIG